MQMLPESKMNASFSTYSTLILPCKCILDKKNSFGEAGEILLAVVGPVHLSAARLLSPSPLLLSARRITC